MSQNDKAAAFGALHRKGNPVIIYNIWDAGTAKAVAEAGAKALGTGSWSVAAAQGYADGEKLPLDALLGTAKSITAAVDLPLSVDFEGGYADDPTELATNVARVIEAGAIGINFEDQVVGGSGIYPVERQAERIRAIRALADTRDMPFFINARTDLFLQEGDRTKHAALLDRGIERAKAYAEAGANGFFAPGLADEELIETLCKASPLPVNIMMFNGVPSPKRLGELGVARVSYGPGPYRAMMTKLKEDAAAVFTAAG
ncbi:isocitrate lyase/phosphoenolpyruvate mutase family protein [Neorhizobium galegae]|uniref:isocitrate lyase/PEP mutase family protein n=1 Tax=Neorhizobium galegae TaxID=399 RepID=UPI0006225D46|nr:isocitrate lyase/phosphoenolpyruvate mutase family protein [Neorhizobium galegae]CDZ26436.1 PEP phosphonomutase [Neorhizobium galegae bv. officinalis]KAA9385805.1 isocitrate lyase/phosphoenolpyruvate mutase family protein [Neorhizobium galegae]KAB1112575.1 isocitrate lyase/phosphoenolpyruvate mutase family protein [Neorhizobium galegae]MCM2497252.1 isocitrate lyase/phosphoenolpyruvate mutase family protein [Neorhizobium galegae]MCQ1772932.1 isocitrate lyase/phosphoenolpyruvate mutase family